MVVASGDVVTELEGTRPGLGEPEDAIKRITHAMRLSPQDSLFFNMQTATAEAHFVAGRYTEALSWAETAVRSLPNYVLPNSIVAARGALVGRLAVAERASARLRQLEPQLHIAGPIDAFPVRLNIVVSELRTNFAPEKTSPTERARLNRPVEILVLFRRGSSGSRASAGISFGCNVHASHDHTRFGP